MVQLMRETARPDTADALSRRIAAFASTVDRRLRQADPKEVLWTIFALVVTVATLSTFIGEAPAPFSFLLAAAGSAGCAWGWLLTRALFRPADALRPWTFVAVGVIAASETWWTLSSGHAAHGFLGELNRIAANAASLVCMAAIVMIFVEALSGYGPSLPARERRFREVYAGVFGALVIVVFLWAANIGEAAPAALVEGLMIATGAICVVGSRLAVSFRKQNPLPQDLRSARAKLAPPPEAADAALAEKVRRAVTDEALLTTPGLKASDFARAIGAQEALVSRCITGALGYRNFNHFVNAHRIALARRMLADQASTPPILTVAYDCGFNSVGPFNRAFKDIVGRTPREYRAEARARAER